MNEDEFQEALELMDDMNLTSDQIDIHDWLILNLTQCRTEIADLLIRIDYWEKRDAESLTRAEKAEAEIKKLEKRIDDWRGLCDTEQITGMDWEERAEKAEAKNKELNTLFELQHTRVIETEKLKAEIGRLKSILANRGILH